MRENGERQKIKVIERIPYIGGKDYRVLVPIGKFEQFGILLPPAIAIATKYNGVVILLNIIEIPYQLPPSAARRFLLERELFLMNGLEMVKESQCKARVEVRIAHRVSYAIDRFAKKEEVNLIIKGRSKNNGLSLWSKRLINLRGKFL